MSIQSISIITINHHFISILISSCRFILKSQFIKQTIHIIHIHFYHQILFIYSIHHHHNHYQTEPHYRYCITDWPLFGVVLPQVMQKGTITSAFTMRAQVTMRAIG